MYFGSCNVWLMAWSDASGLANLAAAFAPLSHCYRATTSTKVLVASRLLSNKSRVRNVGVRAVGVIGSKAAFTVISIYFANPAARTCSGER